MEDMGKDLSKKNYYQYCQDDVLHIKEGIKITEDIWDKYAKHIEDLIVSNKIKDQVAKEIENRIEILNRHWQDFKAAWDFKLPNSAVMREYDPFNPNPDQRDYVDKRQLDCFGQKLTELHHAVKGAAYPGWFERLYQFIKTSLLKLYNCLFAGPRIIKTSLLKLYNCLFADPRNLSGENVYIVAANCGYTALMPSYSPTRHNYFICQEKLRDNMALLQKDLAPIENWQKNSLQAAIYDSASLQRM